MKTYTGATGYVYQYYFVGQRAALEADSAAPATEYIFDVTSDRKNRFAVSIFLQPKAVAAWSDAHGRPLASTEQYAAAKMRLFQAFDEITDMKSEGRRLVVDAENILELLQQLGME